MITGGALPDIDSMVYTGCADGIAAANGSCFSTSVQKHLYKLHTLEELMLKHGCRTEACVLSQLEKARQIPYSIEHVVKTERATRMLPPPPASESALLSNINIDDRLTLAMNHDANLFVNLGFSMVDFNDNRNYRTNLTIPTIFDIINKNPAKKYFASVLNHDVSTGNGTHWVVVFIAAGPKEVVIEYFNSSGIPAPSRVMRWVANFIDRAPSMLKIVRPVRYVQVLDRAMQQMNDITECGVYSLYYVLSRLSGTPCEDFRNAKRTKSDMRKYRSFLFC